MRRIFIAMLTLLTISFGYWMTFPALGEQKKEVLSKPITQSPDTIPIPQPPQKIGPEQIGMISERVLDTALKRLDNAITIFAILMTFIVAAIGIGIGFLQYSQNRHLSEYLDKSIRDLNKRLEDWATVMDLDKRMETWKLKMDEEIKKNVEQKVENLFAVQYRDEIYRYTRSFSEEVIMMTPDARGLLMSRLRTLDREIENFFKESLGVIKSKELYNILGRAIEDWHTLGQLFSPNRTQLQAGLLTIRANPFLGGESRLKVLRERYKDDGELYPMITEAINAIEKLNVEP